MIYCRQVRKGIVMALTKRQYTLSASAIAIVAFAGLSFSGHGPSSILRTSYDLSSPDAAGPDSRAFTASVVTPTPTPVATPDQTAPEAVGSVLAPKTAPSTPSALDSQPDSVIAPTPVPTPEPTPNMNMMVDGRPHSPDAAGVYYQCNGVWSTDKTCGKGDLQLVPTP